MNPSEDKVNLAGRNVFLPNVLKILPNVAAGTKLATAGTTFYETSNELPTKSQLRYVATYVRTYVRTYVVVYELLVSRILNGPLGVGKHDATFDFLNRVFVSLAFRFRFVSLRCRDMSGRG
jgi:hypothetical protein